jgi:prepilin signal peptidase PulO-like enzyme (type II secretory pathway)
MFFNDPSCGAKLRAIDLFPVVSWLFLRGRCRTCKSKISPQYPLVEFFTGVLFVLLFMSASPFFAHVNLLALYFVWNAIIFSILMVIFVYDIHHKIIPDGLSYTFAIMAFIQTFILLPGFSEFQFIFRNIDVPAVFYFVVSFGWKMDWIG